MKKPNVYLEMGHVRGEIKSYRNGLIDRDTAINNIEIIVDQFSKEQTEYCEYLTSLIKLFR